MKQSITVRQKVEALDSQIIPLIKEGMFLEWTIRVDDVDIYLEIYNQWRSEPNDEFNVCLCGESEFFEEKLCIDWDCSATELIEYITEFRFNPYQFAETYGD